MRDVIGLEYLHEDAQMVHRDLKPSNILLTDKNVVKLCDFGISRSTDVSAEHSEAGRSHSMELVGTPEYLAPECLCIMGEYLGTPPPSEFLGISDDQQSDGGAQEPLSQLRCVTVVAPPDKCTQLPPPLNCNAL